MVTFIRHRCSTMHFKHSTMHSKRSTMHYTLAFPCYCIPTSIDSELQIGSYKYIHKISATPNKLINLGIVQKHRLFIALRINHQQPQAPISQAHLAPPTTTYNVPFILSSQTLYSFCCVASSTFLSLVRRVSLPSKAYQAKSFWCSWTSCNSRGEARGSCGAIVSGSHYFELRAL